MTAAPHGRTGERFWKVQPVYDPDGGGADFAYTIGLSHRGFPELHIWARPSLGDDPGLDWKFSVKDCCGILHELAELLVRGDLQVGSMLRREYDGGLAVVEYHVDPPGDRELLEAYGAPEGADVLPVRWSLFRPPTGPPRPLSELDVRRMAKRYDELLGRLGHRDGLPKGWELPVRPSFEVDQRCGPLTPLVLARAAQMTQADAEVLRNFLCISHDVINAMCPTWPMVRARALGRPVGRTPGLDNLATAVDQLIVISAAGCPPAAEMVNRSVRPLLVHRWIADAAGGAGRVRYALEDWLTCLAPCWFTGLTSRQRRSVPLLHQSKACFRTCGVSSTNL